MKYSLFIIMGLTVISAWYIIYRVNKAFRNAKKNAPAFYLEHRQSTIHEIVKSFLPTNEQIKKVLGTKNRHPAQSRQKYREEKIKVVVVGQTAYWVQDNTFYQTQITETGEIDSSSAIPITTDGMTQSEVEELMLILDDLGRNNDDGSGSRD